MSRVTTINNNEYCIYPGDRLFTLDGNIGIFDACSIIPDKARFVGTSVSTTKPGELIVYIEYKEDKRAIIEYTVSYQTKSNETSSSLQVELSESSQLNCKTKSQKQKEKQRRQRAKKENQDWICTGTVDMTRTMKLIKQYCKEMDDKEEEKRQTQKQGNPQPFPL